MSWPDPATLIVAATYLLFRKPIHRWFDKWANRTINKEETP